MTAAIASLWAIKGQLEMISIRNGYDVTVANVYIGRSALAVSRSDSFPVITLTTIRDDPDQTIQSGQLFQTWNRTVMLEAFTTEPSDGTWDEELDTLWGAINTALSRYSGILSWGTVEFIQPQDGGNLCLLRMQLTIPYSMIVE